MYFNVKFALGESSMNVSFLSFMKMQAKCQKNQCHKCKCL